MKLGARIIKTGIAVIVAIYLNKLLGLDSFAFSAVASVIAIQPSVYRSVNHMTEQIRGNLIGAVFAFVGLAILGKEPIVIGLIVIIVILINLKLELEGTVVLSSITVISIMATSPEHSYSYAIGRFSSIMIGVLLAILLNVVFMPPKYESSLLESIKNLSQSLSFLMRKGNDKDFEEKAYREMKNNASSDFSKTEDLFDLFKEEFEDKARIKKAGYKRIKKLVIYKHFLTSIRMQLHTIELLERNVLSNNKIPDDIKEGIQSHIMMLVEYSEKIILRFESKFKSHDKHKRNEILVENNKDLLMKLINPSLSSSLSEDVWMDLFPIVSSLIELSNEFDHLDKLVNNFHLHQE